MRPIAIFDSGVGGLSVYKEIKKLLPHEQILYLADGAHFPYGDKPQQLVRRYALKCLKFLVSPLVARSLGEAPKLIVVACNTATVSGIEYYKKEIPNIPIIGVVPVVKTAAERTKNGRIGIISTMNTASSEFQKHLIEKYCAGKIVFNVGCPNLVHHVEQGTTEGPEIEKELRQILKPIINAKCDVLALGCTHYPFLRRTIDRIIGPQVLFLDSGAAVARHVQRILTQNRALSPVPSDPSTPSLPSSDLFLTTGNPENFKKSIEKLLGIKTSVSHVEIK